jgi:hypothetical protein
MSSRLLATSPSLKEAATPIATRIAADQQPFITRNFGLKDFAPELTPLQAQVLQLLGVPAAAYTG